MSPTPALPENITDGEKDENSMVMGCLTMVKSTNSTMATSRSIKIPRILPPISTLAMPSTTTIT